MRTTFISTATMMHAPRTHLARMQADLAKATEEVASGRMADIGLGLGYQTGRSVDLRNASEQLQSLVDGNATATARLGRSQVALQGLRGAASDFLKGLASRPDANSATSILESKGKAMQASFIDLMNGADGGRFLFGGINSAVRPMTPYADGPKLAVDAAFSTRFGLPAVDPQASPQVSAITPADMEDFLDNEFAALFADPAWGTTWSSASDANIASRISLSDRVDTSASANEDAMRQLAMAYTMVAELGARNLRSDTLDVVLDRATALIGTAITGLTTIEARLGLVENRIASANERLLQEQDITMLRIDDLEGVDPVEAKARIDSLSVQIEMSYATTARVLKLSILNYA